MRREGGLAGLTRVQDGICRFSDAHTPLTERIVSLFVRGRERGMEREKHLLTAESGHFNNQFPFSECGPLGAALAVSGTALVEPPPAATSQAKVLGKQGAVHGA